jgi:hypothetical protein
MTTPSTPILEVAVFTVRAPDSFAEIQRRTHQALATLRGHRTGLRLRGRAGGLFADFIAWDSLDAAQDASAKIREDPRFSALMAGIEQLRLHAHYQLIADIAALLEDLRRAPIVEVAAYVVHDAAVHLGVHEKVHEGLRTQAGYRAGAAARQVEDPGQFADLIGWENAESHRRAGATLQERSELAVFFSGIGEMKVFELFSVVE